MAFQTAAALIGFLLFATPGLVYETLAERRRPVLQLSPLREVSRIALTSVIFSAAAFGILAAARSIQPEWLPDPRRLLADPSEYVVDHYRILLRTLVAQVGIASILASFVALLSHRKGGGRTRPHDVLWTIFHESRAEPTRPFLDILTSEGVWLKGALAAFDVTGPVADRFIALRAPISMRRITETEAQELPKGWERTVVPVDRIVELHVAFAPPEEESGRLERWRTWWRQRPRPLDSSSVQ